MTAFDAAEAEALGTTAHGVIPPERIWENFRYFIRAVAPTAERAASGLACIRMIRPCRACAGIGRVLTSADAMAEAIALADSPAVGLTFCQGSFRTMGEDVPALIRRFAAAGQVAFVHVRTCAAMPTSSPRRFPMMATRTWEPASPPTPRPASMCPSARPCARHGWRSAA